MSRKEIIANIFKSCQSQEFFTTWTASTQWPSSSISTKATTCRLLILDSSFNPPTKAHANLLTKAFTSKPPHYFDASLLLFSTTNADKQLVGASVLQRAQMMELMAKQFTEEYNIAVGFTFHAKFIDKAKAIQTWFKSAPIELYFILGYDTMIRLFDPKYYAPLSVKEALAPFFNQHCHIICADRGGGQGDQEFWDRVYQDYQGDQIHRIRLDSDTETISSTLARSLLQQKEDGHKQLEKILDKGIIEFILKEKIYDD